MVEMKGRKISPGVAEGEALVTKQGLSFFGGVDPSNGKITESGHELEGKSISGKILVFPQGKGSTVGSYALYRMKKQGTAPLALVNSECETIVAVGAIISEIPCVDKIDITKIKTGDKVKVDASIAKVIVK
jgi:predicted aconitase with swiveling domain